MELWYQIFKKNISFYLIFGSNIIKLNCYSIFISLCRFEMLLLLGLLLFTAITWINLLWWLFRILILFLILSLTRFLIKSGFYILVFFAIVYLWIKWISYVKNYFKNISYTQKSRRVSFDNADFVEIVK
jgi:hypothetical protein